MINITNLAAASFMPGLQNSGQVSGTAYISGTLKGSPDYSAGNTSNMTNNSEDPIVIQLPDVEMISLVRVNFPQGAGDLSNFWFPLIGTGVFYDNTNNWKLILYITSHPEGRAIYYNFVNLVNAPFTFTDFPINIYGHLFSYPWS